MVFTEKSYFEQFAGRWLYRHGQIHEGVVPNLITKGQAKLLPLAYYGHPILRKQAEPISAISQDILDLIEDMTETMDGCDGIGLAAPQVHYALQLFVIRVPIETADQRIELGERKVFINPKIEKRGEETWTTQEGCLSIPSIHEDVERPYEITVSYMTEKGEKREEIARGWEARVIQHEYDHLCGILFIDHLPNAKRKTIDPLLRHLEKRIHDGTEL